jgi:type I restriction enzyme S subunit
MAGFHGGAQGGINSAFVDNIFFPLPPLNEQRRIVEKLDAVLPKVRQSVEKLENISDILKKFRQTVLVAACSGELIGLQYQDFKTVELSEITDEIKIGPFGTMLHANDYISNGIPVINPKHIKDQNIFSQSDVTITSEKAKELTAYKLKENDILLGRRGEMGRTAPVTTREAGWLCGTGNIIIRFKKRYCAWLYSRILSSQGIVNYLDSNAKGSTMQNLNERIVSEIPVPDFSIEHQQKIISRVEKLFYLADSLEVKYHKAMGRVVKIEQAVLAKAFRGELAEADPDDEPAEELLKRILSEKNSG